MKFITMAGKSILQDEFGKCFQPQPRTKYHIFSLMWPFWIFSILIRYGLLLPARFLLFVVVSSFAFWVLVPLTWICPRSCSSLLDALLHYYIQGMLLSLGTTVRYHGLKPNPIEPHIFVANHTSVTDLPIASGMGRVHAVVAQAHGGMLGWLSRAVLRPLTDSILFDRNESRDRLIVSKRMRQHVNNVKNCPLLIFPEGTCVNNEYTVLFHKGAFELDCLVCPIAIKYDKTYGDPYFNTREQSFIQHLLYLMTRWINPVDVHFIAPVQKLSEETSVQFSERVKSLISETAGLKNLSWDGYLKNYRPSLEKQDKMRLETRREYLKELFMKLRKHFVFFGPEEVKAQEKCEFVSVSELELEESTPILPEKDYLPEWLSEDEKMSIQNKLLQGAACHHSEFDRKLNKSRENLGIKFKELKETLKPTKKKKKE